MRIHKRLLLVTFAIIISLQSPAQENQEKRWSLNDCINYAIKNNLQMNDAALNVKIAEINYSQSKWNQLPGISAGANVGMNYGRSIDPNTNNIINTSFFNNSYYLNAYIDCFRGFIIRNKIRYYKLRKEVAENNRIIASDDLAFAVMSAFYNVLYNQEILAIANEQRDLSELNVKKTQNLVSNGLKAPADLLEVRANLEKEELFCIQTSNDLASSWITLKKTMNLSPEKQIDLEVLKNETEIANLVLPNIHDLYQLHNSWSPRIQFYENEWQASIKNVDMSRSGFFPSIRFLASYNTGFYETNRDANNQIYDFGYQIRNNRSQFVVVSIVIPIFGKNEVRFDIRRSQLASEQAHIRLELAKQTLLYEMEENFNELRASEKEFQQAKKQLEADKLAFESAQKKFNQGMINVIEFYTTKNRMTNTIAQVLHSRLTLEMMRRTIDFYQGKRFWE